jgi:hypothetical protein
MASSSAATKPRCHAALSIGRCTPRASRVRPACRRRRPPGAGCGGRVPLDRAPLRIASVPSSLAPRRRLARPHPPETSHAWQVEGYAFLSGVLDAPDRHEQRTRHLQDLRPAATPENQAKGGTASTAAMHAATSPTSNAGASRGGPSRPPRQRHSPRSTPTRWTTSSGSVRASEPRSTAGSRWARSSTRSSTPPSSSPGSWTGYSAASRRTPCSRTAATSVPSTSSSSSTSCSAVSPRPTSPFRPRQMGGGGRRGAAAPAPCRTWTRPSVRASRSAGKQALHQTRRKAAFAANGCVLGLVSRAATYPFRNVVVGVVDQVVPSAAHLARVQLRDALIGDMLVTHMNWAGWVSAIVPHGTNREVWGKGHRDLVGPVPSDAGGRRGLAMFMQTSRDHCFHALMAARSRTRRRLGQRRGPPVGHLCLSRSWTPRRTSPGHHAVTGATLTPTGVRKGHLTWSLPA